MKTITKQMIEEYGLKTARFDFMGYTFQRLNDLSFHHLIIPKKDSHKMGIGEGYLKWNGAILNQETSHDYLHIIGNVDREVFMAITKLMIQENQIGHLDFPTLKKIRDILLYFEAHHMDDTKADGKKIIREKYLTKRINF